MRARAASERSVQSGQLATMHKASLDMHFSSAAEDALDNNAGRVDSHLAHGSGNCALEYGISHGQAPVLDQGREVALNDGIVTPPRTSTS